MASVVQPPQSGKQFSRFLSVAFGRKQLHDAPSSKAEQAVQTRELTPPDAQSPAQQLIATSASLHGWCSAEKAQMLFDLVVQEKPETCVEIGIFGGRSLVPIAAGLRQNGSGHVYGIETWRPDVATEHDTSAENDAWWRELDFDRIKLSFYRFLADHELTKIVRVIEAPSATAAALLPAIDFIHIDGAHSTYNAAEDVVLYVKKLKRGGVVVFDDVDWNTTAPAVAILAAICDPVAEIMNDNGQVACVAMRRR